VISLSPTNFVVMAGLVPAIHVFELAMH